MDFRNKAGPHTCTNIDIIDLKDLRETAKSLLDQ